MAGYVLVHGGNMSTETWNRFTVAAPVETPDGRMGGRIWDPVIPALPADHVYAPTLLDENTCDLTAHIEQIVQLVLAHDLRDLVLAGHSYGGMVITGAAARLPDRIGALVYVDAALPEPGESLFDIIESGGVDPFSFAGLEAAPPYVEQLQFDDRLLARLRKTYVRCTKSEFAAASRLAQARIERRPGGWRYLELPAWHVPMADMPQRVAEILRSA